MPVTRLQGRSRSLRNQVADLESQLMLRRRRVRGLAADIPRKLASRLASPGMLLAAAGAGVAVEQAGHQRGWSKSLLVQVASTFVGLLFSRPASVPQTEAGAGRLAR